jgi:hypothetical protein
MNENIEERINLQKAVFEIEDANLFNRYELKQLDEFLEAGGWVKLGSVYKLGSVHKLGSVPASRELPSTLLVLWISSYASTVDASSS